MTFDNLKIKLEKYSVIVVKIKNYFSIIEKQFGGKYEKFLYSPLNIIVWMVIATITYVCSAEIIFYGVVAVYAIYVILFCHDFAPLMHLFPFCYVTVSQENNPGIYSTGIYRGESAIYIVFLATIVILAVVVRISLNKGIGWKHFFAQRSGILLGLLILSLAYLLSGIGSENYFKYVKNNFVFALIQIVALCLLYCIFSATVKWNVFDNDYFATIGLAAGILVVFELIWIYVTKDPIKLGTIDRDSIWTGWGTYNNIGAMIALAIPFAFYFACKRKHNWFYLLLAVVLLVGVIFSCSRGSIVFAIVSFIISYTCTFFRTKNKKCFYLTSIVLLGIVIVSGIAYSDAVQTIFARVPGIADLVDGNVVFNDSRRIEIYIEGWKTFLKNPIFGQTFYSANYDLPDFSVIDEFSSFFPPRWHNTIIQLLASCGSVGLLAYLFHRYQTIRMIIKKPTTINIYIGIYILTLVGLSMVDCHFFNVGPTLFYSMALAVMEFGHSPDEEHKFVNPQ